MLCCAVLCFSLLAFPNTFSFCLYQFVWIFLISGCVDGSVCLCFHVHCAILCVHKIKYIHITVAEMRLCALTQNTNKMCFYFIFVRFVLSVELTPTWFAFVDMKHELHTRPFSITQLTRDETIESSATIQCNRTDASILPRIRRSFTMETLIVRFYMGACAYALRSIVEWQPLQ